MRQIVKERVKSLGVKQKYIAYKCGYSEKAFSLMINGKKPIKDGDIEKFCAAMGVFPNDIIKTGEAGKG